jgi:hypothetical protein
LLAHELAHVTQQARDAALPPSALRLGAGNTPQEREADGISHRIHTAAAAARPGEGRQAPVGESVLQRQPSPTAQVNLTIDTRGRVDLTVAGPNLGPVSGPTIGIRRNANGTYDLLVGARRQTVAASEIPSMLRGMLGGAGKPGGKLSEKNLRVPTCDQLQAAGGNRFMTFAEYRVSRMLSPTLLPMTPALYDALLMTCPPPTFELPEAPEPELQDAPIPVSTEDTALA